MKRIGFFLCLTAFGLSFYLFELHRFFNLAALQEHLTLLQAWQSDRPWLLRGSFFVIYVLLAGLSLPGATIMTLAAGALFGLLWGTLLASFASSLGALFAFLTSRYLLRDWIRDKLSTRFDRLDAGMKKDGAMYLFSLRMIPLVPFFLVNLGLGLTSLPARTFYWVSQLGMLAGTAVYVNAGAQVSKLQTTADILSFELILSFTLIGVLPMAAQKTVQSLQKRQLKGNWKRPKRFDRNLIVIGAGAGGLVTAYIAAAAKAKVTLVEAHKMGGDCLNYGCVPSKALIKSAKIAHQIRHASQYGLEDSEPNFSFPKVMQRVQDVIAAVAPHDSIERYSALGVEVLQGYAKLITPWEVEIQQHNGASQSLSARSIVLATGASPFIPPLPGLEEVGYLTSDNLWEAFLKMESAPKRLVLLGGGPIGCELAQALARLGSQVTQIEMGDRILAREDVEVSRLAQTTLEADGVKVLTGHKALRCEIINQQKQIIVEHQGQEQAIAFDVLLCAVGRAARLQGYGLEDLGIPVGRTIETNEYLETLYPHIYAVGDVAGPYQFTHTAAYQAWFAAVNALFGKLKRFKPDYRVIPWCTFLDPEVARVGLNEQEATAQGIAYEVTLYHLADLDRAIAEGATAGFIKVLTVPAKDKILGVTLVGAQAGDLLAEFVLAMKHGLGLNNILSTIHPYPTWVEGNKYVAGQWKKAHVSPTALSLLEAYHRWRRG